MPDVIVEYPACTSDVSTRGISENTSATHVLWAPSVDRWLPPQKTPRGGGASGRSVATRRAGVDLYIRGADVIAVEGLVAAVVRSLRLHGGPEPFITLEPGQWRAPTGAMTAGEMYLLPIAVAIDVPALPDPPRTATPTTAALDTTRSATGDGFTDAGEPG